MTWNRIDVDLRALDDPPRVPHPHEDRYPDGTTDERRCHQRLHVWYLEERPGAPQICVPGAASRPCQEGHYSATADFPGWENLAGKRVIQRRLTPHDIERIVDEQEMPN